MEYYYNDNLNNYQRQIGKKKLNKFNSIRLAKKFYTWYTTNQTLNTIGMIVPPLLGFVL